MLAGIPRAPTFATLLPLMALLALSGCSYLGYQQYRPREINEYDAMLTDPLQSLKRDGWIWVRGKVSGDLDGDKNDEEVVLATLQPGDAAEPKAITKALLLVCSRDDKEGLRLLLRRHIFDADRSLNESALPQAIHIPRPQGGFTQCSARIVDVDTTGHGLVLVSLWRPLPTGEVAALHLGYRFHRLPGHPSTLTSVFRALAVQQDATIHTVDLDKDGRDELLIPQSVLPPDRFPGAEDLERPEWYSVYAVQPDGTYRQHDRDFPSASDALLLPWYQYYVLSLHGGAGPGALATTAYYMGRMHAVRNETKTARVFLRLALERAEGARLKSLIQDTLRLCDVLERQEGPRH